MITSSRDALSYPSNDWDLQLQQGPEDLGFDTSYITISGIQDPPYAFLRNGKFQQNDLNENARFWRAGNYSMPEGTSIIDGGHEGEGAPDWDSTAYNMILVND